MIQYHNDLKMVIESCIGDDSDLIREVSITNNHIKLFPIKKEESWNKIYKDFYELHAKEMEEGKMNGQYMRKLREFLEVNYNPPTKK